MNLVLRVAEVPGDSRQGSSRPAISLYRSPPILPVQGQWQASAVSCRQAAVTGEAFSSFEFQEETPFWRRARMRVV